MSEFLAEAQILVRPDTTRFRAELQTELLAATRGITAPIPVTAVVTGTTGLQAVTGQAAAASAAIASVNREQAAGAAITRQAARADLERARSLKQIETAALASAAGMTGLRGAVLTAGAGFLGATVAIQSFSRAIGAAAELETTLNVFRVTVGATADEMERVGEQAKLLGRDLTLPGVTATDAAESFLTLARAGLTVENALAGARGTLQLAVAAEISFADAATLTASALNAFGLAGEEAVSVADTLTNAANASQASISDMGIALQQSAAIADLVGFSLSETVTFLTQLAQAGLRGSDAGTSFRVAIQRLIAPTDRAREALDKLNVNLRDASGNLRPEAFFELGDALERMGRAQADTTRQVIFGNDASRAAAFFARLNSELFREQERDLRKQGSAAEVAGAKNEGFAGSVENAKNQVAAFGIELGELALPIVGGALDVVAFGFGTLATEISETRKVFGGLQEDIDKLRGAATDLSEDSGFTDFLSEVGDGARLVGGGIRDASNATDAFIADLAGIGGGAEVANREIQELASEEQRLGKAVFETTGPVEEQTSGLNRLAAAAAAAAQAVARLQGQQAGLEEQVTRSRIAEDENAELQNLISLRSSLEEELRRQEAIIARPGAGGEATARDAIRNRILPQLEQVNNEIDRIIEGQAATRQRQAQDAARAAEDADRDLLNALSGQRTSQEQQIARAEQTEGLQDDIRENLQLRRLITEQIRVIRAQVDDVKAQQAAVQALITARIALTGDIRRLRETQRREREEAARARQEQLDTIQELNIQIAQERGNDAALERAIRQRLNTINKQIDAAKGDQIRVKQLILERERLRNQLEDLNKVEEDNRQTAQEFFFEQLQAQQGFAANLLGNLVPRDQTAGLVGVPSPTGLPPIGIEAGIGGAARAAEGRSRSNPTAGQVSTTNDILLRILDQLKNLNRAADSPEAIYQRKQGAATMTGGGGNVVVM